MSVEQLKEQFPNISEDKWPILEEWAVLLRDWNSKINLISRKDIEYLEERHLSHCLEITNHLKLMNGTRIMDVGTGGGFPGIIMAICYPQAQFLLIDAIGKKIKVVQDLIDQLGLKNVEAKHTRAEAITKQFDFVTGRAVKNLPEYFSWIKKNVRRGEKNTIPNGVLYWKGGDMDDEFEALGIRPRKVIHLEETFSDPYFEQKCILHFDARDVPRARKPKPVEK